MGVEGGKKRIIPVVESQWKENPVAQVEKVMHQSYHTIANDINKEKKTVLIQNIYLNL